LSFDSSCDWLTDPLPLLQPAINRAALTETPMNAVRFVDLTVIAIPLG
jgi:hypothetical protein